MSLIFSLSILSFPFFSFFLFLLLYSGAQKSISFSASIAARFLVTFSLKNTMFLGRLGAEGERGKRVPRGGLFFFFLSFF